MTSAAQESPAFPARVRGSRGVSVAAPDAGCSAGPLKGAALRRIATGRVALPVARTCPRIAEVGPARNADLPNESSMTVVPC